MGDASLPDGSTSLVSARRATTTDRADISILIVAFNSAALIEKCIEAIPQSCPGYTYEIRLIDNGDGTTESLVRARFPDVQIEPSRGNIGFAAGNNALAGPSSGRFVLLLNPDMVPAPGSIAALMDATRRYPDAGAWGAVTLDETGAPDTGNDIALPSLRELLTIAVGLTSLGREPVRGLEDDAKVDVLCGGFVLFARSVWDRAGGLDESYFLYCEEVDLFYRLAGMGYECWRIPAARGYHAMGHGNGLSPMRLLYRAAGTMQFARLHWSVPKRWLAFVLIWFAALTRFGAGLLLGWRGGRFARLRDGYRLVALKPHHWAWGYHHMRGLLARMQRTKTS